MPRRTLLDEIRRLDPEKDYRRIVFLDTFHEFPWDTTRSLEFALFRTFAVASIGGLLAQTGEFTHRPQRRNDDTELILSEVLENSYDSPRGRAPKALYFGRTGFPAFPAASFATRGQHCEPGRHAKYGCRLQRCATYRATAREESEQVAGRRNENGHYARTG